MRAKAVRIACCIAMACGGTLAMSGVAAAAEECGEISGASACFESYGDKITVRDNAKDGAHPRVQWTTSYGRDGMCVGSTAGEGSVQACNYDMREGETITFWPQVWDGNTKVREGPGLSATI